MQYFLGSRCGFAGANIHLLAKGEESKGTAILDIMALNLVELAQAAKGDTNVLPRSKPNEQESMKLLTTLAVEQIHADKQFLGKTRLSVDKQARTLSYDLSSVPPRVVLSYGDPLANPLEILIRAESLRRDFRSFIPNEKFWVMPLDSIEQIIGGCLEDLEGSQAIQVALSNQKECSSRIHAQFERLRTMINTYAVTRGLRVVEPQSDRDPTLGYRVYIKIDPPTARVKVMTLLDYKKYQYLKTPKEEYRWADLLDSEGDMIGWYHYRAEWPPELNGPDEGNFEVKKPGNITFTPIRK